MTSEEPANNQDKASFNRVVEVSIHIGLLILLTGGCLLIMLPFVPFIVWGIVIAVAGYPAYRKLQGMLGGRSGLAATLFTLVLLTLLVLPVVSLTGTLVEGIQTLAAHLKDGTLTVPPPPIGLETWPIIGIPLKTIWSAASTNLTDLLKSFAPQIKETIPKLLLLPLWWASLYCNSFYLYSSPGSS